jgi:hypothetical protein
MKKVKMAKKSPSVLISTEGLISDVLDQSMARRTP